MSIQTHTAKSSAPPRSRWRDALGYRLKQLVEQPNPVWVRELRQSARLTRTPVILAVMTGMMTLLIASIGGILSTTAEPAQVGIGIFHTFFSLAFAVVTWVGPAVAAATIASERSGKTWEALLLSNLTPARIARGKFLAALTYVLLYIVMLAPVGALAFLFGGVTPTEVLSAFVLLGLIAGLSVAFGLAMSSQFGSPAVAILVTLLVAVPLSILSYLLGGVGLSFAVHQLWGSVSAGPPVWLPTAYTRADFGVPYFTVLLVLPLLATILPGWLFYEVTIANMAAPSDDRSTRLRIWALTAAPLLTLGMALGTVALGTRDFYLGGQTLLWILCVFLAFLVAGEPLGPSARVEARWARRGVGRVRRWVGPGVGRAGAATALLTVACSGGLAAAGFVLASSRDERLVTLTFGGYACGFALFSTGLASFARARAGSAAVARLSLAGALFLALLGPYIAMAIGGMLSSGSERALLMAAPSPAFAFVVVDRLRSAGGDADLYAIAGAVASAGWALFGLGLLLHGAFTAKKRWNADPMRQKALPGPSLPNAA